MMAAAGRGGRVRREACSPRWDAASSTEGTLPVLGAARMQAEKPAVQRGRAEDDGSDRQLPRRVSAMKAAAGRGGSVLREASVLAALGRGIEY